MSKVLFKIADIEANFNERDMVRGRGYWRNGAVRSMEITSGGRLLWGKVAGSRKEPYDVWVTITPKTPTARGVMPIKIASDCSCPVGHGCKHGAALCLAAFYHNYPDNIAPPPPITDPPLSDRTVESALELVRTTLKNLKDQQEQDAAPPRQIAPWETWLEGLTHSCEQATTGINRPREFIAYILEIGENNWRSAPKYLRVRITVTRILKGGGYDVPRNLTPLDLVRRQVKYISADDTLIGQLMQENHTAEFRSPPVGAGILDMVMRRVLETGRCFYQKCEGAPLSFGEPRPAKLGWHTEIDGAQVPAIVREDESESLIILPSVHPWYIEPATRQAGRLDFGVPTPVVSQFLAGPKILPEAIGPVAERMAAIQTFAGVIAPPRRLRVENRLPAPPLPCLRLVMQTVDPHWNAGEQDYPLALLHFDYAGISVDPSAPDRLHKRTQDLLINIPRDRKSEDNFMASLAQDSGLVPFAGSERPLGVPLERLAYQMPTGWNVRVQWLTFLHQVVPALRAKGTRVAIDSDFAAAFRTIEVNDSDWEANLHEQEGCAAWWFSLDLGILVEDLRVPLLPLLVQALKRLKEPTTVAIEGLACSGQLYVDLPDGRALALPFERVRDILTTLVELYDRPLNPDGTMTLSLDLASALSRIDAATKMRWLGGDRLRTLIERLKNFNGLTDIAPPRGLLATLRPYQREGLNWLQFLRDYQLSGVLADDMGLGKTVQTLAHLLVEKEAGRLDKPCLILCPTSLIPNWQDEAERFTPGLRVLSLHGKDRATRFGEIATADLVLSTYPLLTRDAEVLLAVEWYLVVLDEAQAIKNPSARITQLACEIQAKHRLCLTGTPVENHLGEAWSQFAFLMPGMLGTHKDFTKRFRNPIEKMQDTERQSVLSRRLKPFILRRNKSEVAKELPPKTEIVHLVDLNEPQRDLYETLRLAMHEKVQQTVSEKGFNRSRIVILDALLKLRQVCCDPRLVKLTRARKAVRSAKLESLMEILPEMIEEGRKVLLFSQFTSMLDLIKPELLKAHIAFVEIRGDTDDRKTPVTTFQNGEVPLFLISLKAGGTGLNLTAADTVIHYDPWWNPAVETQATDRAHRIGQDKPVFVYKFIARGTVEERILELQNRKRSLAAALLEERPDATAAFEAGDLEFLFRETG